MVIDGVYRTKANGEPEFVEIPAPSEEQVWEVLERIIKRVMKQLVRRGTLVEDQGERYLADDEDDSDEARAIRLLHRGSCVNRIAFGPRAGQKLLTLRGALLRNASGKQKLCANLQGFSLHAGVRCGAGQRNTLERLCRYITRPALANDRVQVNAAGQVELEVALAGRHAASDDVAPGVHAAAGGAGAKTKATSDSLPQGAGPKRQTACQGGAPVTRGASQGAPSPEDGEAAQGRPMRLGWAKLLKRILNLDLEHFPNCGGTLTIIAAILERPAIEKILTHVGVDARPPPRSPARGQMSFQVV